MTAFNIGTEGTLWWTMAIEPWEYGLSTLELRIIDASLTTFFLHFSVKRNFPFTPQLKAKEVLIHAQLFNWVTSTGHAASACGQILPWRGGHEVTLTNEISSPEDSWM